MPRGRHRHSPPLHRLLPSTAIAGVSVVCALAPWVFAGTGVLRALSAVVAVTAVAGAVVMRRWDAQAGKQVADLTRARASDEWRFEERVAELETDLEEAREVRAKLERRLRAKRAELAGLRNEHASLLRRYATAETERASALEGRRLLELESGDSADALALPPGTGAESEEGAAAEEPTEPQVQERDDDVVASRPEPAASVFSAEGAELFRRAGTALARLDRDRERERAAAKSESAKSTAARSETARAASIPAETATSETVESEPADPEPVDAEAEADSASQADSGEVTGAADTETGVEATTETAPDPDADTHTRAEATPEPAAEAPVSARHARRAGHFTVPTAVAVVSPQPTRRPGVEGGFDFFGTQKQTATPALGAVQNEDLADVVGQEALALHKADAESGYKPAVGEAGQVIDLTAHDETEHIDVQGLRSVVS
ncbi:hypothetical protein [Streptomyces sp. LaPpAH-108]|uniref:hypothetical protein n=1 Tax=Streptomyces sp. LaPpAH-108 TaxID=1155714 RepID=UPI00036BB58E|nr:hypothetical protein [Streptomyces sp. LaPpAH-108]